jgi:hypothetical protein
VRSWRSMVGVLLTVLYHIDGRECICDDFATRNS